MRRTILYVRDEKETNSTGLHQRERWIFLTLLSGHTCPVSVSNSYSVRLSPIASKSSMEPNLGRNCLRRPLAFLISANVRAAVIIETTPLVKTSISSLKNGHHLNCGQEGHKSPRSRSISSEEFALPRLQKSPDLCQEQPLSPSGISEFDVVDANRTRPFPYRVSCSV